MTIQASRLLVHRPRRLKLAAGPLRTQHTRTRLTLNNSKRRGEKTVRMLDLPAEARLYGDAIRQAVTRVLESGQFIGGSQIAELEAAVCRRFSAARAIAVSSGTDALLCTLMALEVGPGDEVIVPALTFFATAGAVWRVGARPVFVDVEPHTFNIDPNGLESAINARTRAVIPVHLFGQCAAMEAIGAIAERHGLTVVEDAAQAIGATASGQYAGTMGRAGCLSFYPTKNLGGIGEGGMILTGDEALAERLRRLRNQGETRRYTNEFVGGNFRLDSLKAATLLVKLEHLDEFTRRRQAHARHYDRVLADAEVETPDVAAGNVHVYHQYSILCGRRDALAEFLRRRGVQTAVYYPLPLHLQPCFARLGYQPGSLPVSESVCQRILSLPCHPMLSEEDVEYVAETIREFRMKNSE